MGYFQQGVNYNPSFGFAKRYIPKAYPYFATQPSVLPVDIAVVKSYLRLDPDNTVEDAVVDLMTKAVVEFAEGYTRRIFISRTFTTYRDDFSDNVMQLRRTPFQSLTSFEYLVNGVWTTVPSDLYSIKLMEEGYSAIYLNDDKIWPTDIDLKMQSVRIVFVCGYGATEANVPPDIKMAMMQHIAAVYENRGDCDGGNCKSSMPSGAKELYDSYKTLSITAEPY